MVNVKEITEILADLTTLQHFPADKHARNAIVRMVCAMVGADPKVSPVDQTRWLVARLIVLFDVWPGPKQFRAVFCSRFKPRDGIEAVADTKAFPDGFPADPTLPLMLPQPPARQISRGDLVTQDEELAEGFAALMKSSEMPRVRLSAEERQKEARFNRLLEATITAPCDRTDSPLTPPTPQVITQADVNALTKRRA